MTCLIVFIALLVTRQRVMPDVTNDLIKQEGIGIGLGHWTAMMNA